MARRSLGTLTLDLIARVGGFEQGMDKAARVSAKRMGEIERQVKRVTTVLAGLGAAAIASTAALVRSQINLADATAKTADRLGFTTEELSKLRYAAEMTGVASNTFEMAMQRMTRRLGEAATGAGEAVGALRELGLDAQALSDAGPAEAFKTIADALSEVPSQADRVRLAFKFFDSEGVKLVNTIANGRAGIEALGDELERLGGVIDSDAARRAEELNDNLSRFRTTITGVGNELAIGLLPTLVEFTDLLQDSEVQEGIRSIVTGIADIAVYATRATAAVAGLTRFLAEETAAFLHGPAIGDVVRIDEEIAETERRLSSLREQLRAEEESAATRVAGVIGRAYAAAYGVTIDASADAKTEIETLEKRLRHLQTLRRYSAPSVIDEPSAPATGGSRSVADLAAARAEQERQEEALKRQKALESAFDSQLARYQEQIALTGRVTELERVRYAITEGALVGIDEAQQKRLEGLAAEIDRLARLNTLQREATAIVEGLRTEEERALDTYIEKINILNQAMAEGIPIVGGYEQARQRIGEEYERTLDELKKTTDSMSVYAEQAARNMQSVFADFLFDPFNEGLEGMLKGFLRVIQRIAAEAAAAQIFDAIGGWGRSSNVGWVQTLAGAFAGSRATGGPTAPGSLYRVNERGPELYTERGQTYLMSGADGGFVTPLASGASGAPINVVVNIDSGGLAGVTSDATGLEQFGSELGRFVEQKYRQLVARDLSDGGQIKRAMSGGYR